MILNNDKIGFCNFNRNIHLKKTKTRLEIHPEINSED